MSDLSEFANLSISDKKQRFGKELVPKIENFPISNFANSIFPLDLANFSLVDHQQLPKMPKRKRSNQDVSEEEESICSVKIRDRIDAVLAETKHLKKPGNMVYANVRKGNHTSHLPKIARDLKNWTKS